MALRPSLAAFERPLEVLPALPDVRRQIGRGYSTYSESKTSLSKQSSNGASPSRTTLFQLARQSR